MTQKQNHIKEEIIFNCIHFLDNFEFLTLMSKFATSNKIDLVNAKILCNRNIYHKYTIIR
jgi:hypothetical protein